MVIMKLKNSKVMIITISLILLFSTSQVLVTTMGEFTEGEGVNTISRVVVFSFDAFRYDYFDITDLPTFDWLIQQGVKADYCLPANPSLTAVNHVSMITGCYAGSHGIMGNTFYDWTDNTTYSMFSDPSDPYRSTATGLHLLQTKPSVIHAEENDIETAVIAWPYVDDGTEYEGNAPTYVLDYDYVGAQGIRTNAGIAGKVVDLIKNHPEIGIFYAWCPAVDQAGHYSGFDTTMMINNLVNLDNTLKSFLQELEKEDLLKETVVIVTSDHGMSAIDDDEYFLEEKAFFINATVQTGLDPIIAVDAPLCYLYFADETNTTKAEEFASYIEGQEGIEAVYVNEENEDIQLGNNQGRGINISVWLEPNVTRNFGSAYVGMHGYLNTNTDMQGIFLVAGPGIKQNAVIGGMNTIDVAPTVLSLLDIDTGFTCDGIPLATIKSPRTEAFSYPVEETSFSYLSFMLVILIIPIVNRIRRKRK